MEVAFSKAKRRPERHREGSDEAGSGLLIMTNFANGEGIYEELPKTLQHNSFTSIEREGFAPYSQTN